MGGSLGTMDKLGDTNRRLYGPRGLLVCGVPPTEQDALCGLAEGLEEALPVVFVTDADIGRTLGALLALPAGHGLGQPTGLRRAVIMSGVTETELHLLMSAYRRLRLERPLWATLTPTSERWAFERLLGELIAEDDHFAR